MEFFKKIFIPLLRATTLTTSTHNILNSKTGKTIRHTSYKYSETCLQPNRNGRKLFRCRKAPFNAGTLNMYYRDTRTTKL